MGSLKFLTIEVVYDVDRNTIIVVSADDFVAWRQIVSRLKYPLKPALFDFLTEAVNQHWEVVDSKNNTVLLKKYQPDVSDSSFPDPS